MKVTVKCSFVIEVEVSDDQDPHFTLEDNGCPGTGIVGAALEKVIKKCRSEWVCWACRLQGENEIIAIHKDGILQQLG